MFKHGGHALLDRLSVIAVTILLVEFIDQDKQTACRHVCNIVQFCANLLIGFGI
ncbi:Uncharacterised protein [Enterobacter hormaechei]|nr:Uncharacterised protein [Enterobacter hormaechei]